MRACSSYCEQYGFFFKSGLAFVAMKGEFSWTLPGIEKKNPTAMERAIATRANIENGFIKSDHVALGGAVDSDCTRSEKKDGVERQETLVVSWMLSVLRNFPQTGSRWFHTCDHLSRFVYIFSWLLCAGSAAMAFLEPRLFLLSALDLFAWTVWSLFACSEVLLAWMRIENRLQFESYQDSTPSDFVVAIVHRRPFKNLAEAYAATSWNVAASCVSLIGVLTIQIQMIADDGNLVAVAPENRRVWRVAFSVVFLAVVFGFIYAACMDPARTRRDTVACLPEKTTTITSCAIQLVAWRTLVLVLLTSCLSVAFVAYASLCCNSDIAIVWQW